MVCDIHKFSFAEMTSNQDGKTSGSGTMGVLICVNGCLGFIIGCVDKIFMGSDIDIITQSIVFVGIGAALLGYRKLKASNDECPGVEQSVTDPSVELPETSDSCPTCGRAYK